MREIIINDPNDVVYPLSKDVYEDLKILYHGTSNSYMERIEKKGWCKNDQPHDMKDIKYICEVFESLD